MGKTSKGHVDNTPVPEQPSEVSEETLQENRRLASVARREEEKLQKEAARKKIQEVFYQKQDRYFFCTVRGEEEEYVIDAATAREAARVLLSFRNIKEGVVNVRSMVWAENHGEVNEQNYRVSLTNIMSEGRRMLYYSVLPLDKYLVKFTEPEATFESEATNVYEAIYNAAKECFAGMTFALGEGISYKTKNLRTKERYSGTLTMDMS